MEHESEQRLKCSCGLCAHTPFSRDRFHASKKKKKMNLIKTIEEIKLNLETVEKYLSEGTEFEEDETKKLIKRGSCFMAYRIAGELRFAPSRFIGYKNNNLLKAIQKTEEKLIEL